MVTKNILRTLFCDKLSIKKEYYEEILNVQEKAVGDGSLVRFRNTDTFYLLELLSFIRKKIEESATNY